MPTYADTRCPSQFHSAVVHFSPAVPFWIHGVLVLSCKLRLFAASFACSSFTVHFIHSLPAWVHASSTAIGPYRNAHESYILLTGPGCSCCSSRDYKAFFNSTELNWFQCQRVQIEIFPCACNKSVDGSVVVVAAASFTRSIAVSGNGRAVDGGHYPAAWLSYEILILCKFELLFYGSRAGWNEL